MDSDQTNKGLIGARQKNMNAPEVEGSAEAEPFGGSGEGAFLT